MKKITSLSAEEFSKFIVDKKTGEVTIPEGYELRKTETREEKINKAILDLEQEISEVSPPTDEELIEEGRSIHPYFVLNTELLHYYDLKIKINK